MKDEVSELRHARALIAALLERIGEHGDCPDCGAHVYWVRHRRTNAIEAYDPDGASHDFKCVAAIYRRRRDLAKVPAAHADVLTESAPAIPAVDRTRS